jgi:hypothetical protein
MDVILHKLSSMGTHVSLRDSAGSSGRNDNGGGDVSIAIDTASQTTKEERNRRKMR